MLQGNGTALIEGIPVSVVGPNAFGEAHVRRYGRNLEIPTHSHLRPSLCLLLAGEYEERILSRTDIHRSGDLLYCPGAQPHGQKVYNCGAVKLVIELTQSSVDYLSEHLCLGDAPWARGAEFGPIGRKIAAEIKLRDPFSDSIVDGAVLELLATFARRACVNDGRDSQMCRLATDWIIGKLEEPISIAQLARAVNRHPVALTREFRRAFGCTPAEFHRRMRIERSLELLDRTSLPLSEVALRCGFYDQSHFTRMFRAHIGCTPGQFRRSR